MTDPIAKGVKLEDAIVILREGLRSDRPLTLKERLLIGKIIDEHAALTAAGEMARERPKWKLVPEASLLSVIGSIDMGCDPADKHNITVNEHYWVLRQIALSDVQPTPMQTKTYNGMRNNE